MNKAILCLLASFLAQTLIFAVMPVQALSTKDRIPFHAGEKLSYVLKWSIIPVGEATLEVLNGEMKTGESAYLLKVSVKSYPIIDLFYRVRDHIESYVDRSVTHSLLYRKKQHEGRHERDIMVNFDWDKAKAHYYNKGKHERSVNILPGTFDPLSVFYAFRLYPLKDGLEVETPVTDGKKCVMGRAKVIKRERMKVDAGEFDTFLIEPELQNIGGIFKKSKDAKLRVWVTADDRRILVKAESKVVVGHFTAELVSAEGVLQ
ncbi:MAG: hypothetical protein BBJ60_03015 [Desulfobacterales bacterium S7086C20]|nr:MAG: hypothetical protein BBJ60_03015 [Desulfobacterales bacterium S7086C20]